MGTLRDDICGFRSWSMFAGVPQGLLLVNRYFGTVRKIVLYDVTEQVDSQTIEHFVWSSAS